MQWILNKSWKLWSKMLSQKLHPLFYEWSKFCTLLLSLYYLLHLEMVLWTASNPIYVLTIGREMWLTVNNFAKLKCMIWFKKRFISQCFTLFWKVLQNILDLTWQQYTLTTNENVYCLLSSPTLAQGIQNICFYIYCHLLYDIKINCPFFSVYGAF